MWQKNRFIFFGTPAVARDTLAALSVAGFTPIAVVTNPDAPKGRGLALSPSPVKEWAEDHGIPILTPERLTPGTAEELRRHGADYAIVVAYGKIFPEELIAAFPLGVLNIHYSLLPKYRGASPVEAALLAGETMTGVTIQKMVKELDAGDILAQQGVAIGPSDTARELKPRLITEGADLLIKTLPVFEAGGLAPTPQDPAKATRCKKIRKEEGLLDLSAPAEANWNTYRAYIESPGTYFFENGKRMKITKARFENGEFIVDRVIPEGKRETDYRPQP